MASSLNSWIYNKKVIIQLIVQYRTIFGLVPRWLKVNIILTIRLLQYGSRLFTCPNLFRYCTVNCIIIYKYVVQIIRCSHNGLKITLPPPQPDTQYVKLLILLSPQGLTSLKPIRKAPRPWSLVNYETKVCSYLFILFSILTSIIQIFTWYLYIPLFFCNICIDLTKTLLHV